MGLFNQFPFTNFHEMNLDWVIKAIKESKETLENFDSNMESIVNKKIDALINSGYFDTILSELNKNKPYIVNDYKSISKITPSINEYIIMQNSNGAMGIYKADNINKTGSIKCTNNIYVNVVGGNGYADIFGADYTGISYSDAAINNTYNFFGFVILKGIFKVKNTVKANIIIGNNATITRDTWTSAKALINVYQTDDVYYKDFNIVINDNIDGSIIRTQDNKKIYVDNVNIRRTGDSINSLGAWAFTISCETFIIKNCYIDTLSSGETGDGIHIVKAEYGVIDSCYIKAGDDAIALFTQNISASGDINNVFINDCFISSPNYSGIKIGSKNSFHPYNCFVSNCRFSNCKTYITSTQNDNNNHNIYLYNCSSDIENSDIAAIQANNSGMNLFIDGGNYVYKKFTQLTMKSINVKNAILNGTNFLGSIQQTATVLIKDCEITGIVSANDGQMIIAMNNVFRNTTNVFYRSSSDTTKTCVFANIFINSTMTLNGPDNIKINNQFLTI